MDTYYQKEMKTPYVIMERSAMGIKQKMEILSNELNRRLTNVDSEILSKMEINIVLEQFTQELKNSGYTNEQSREIVISGYRGWKRRIERRRNTGLYRHAIDTLEERERKKLIERETWYIPQPGDDEQTPEQTNQYKMTKPKTSTTSIRGAASGKKKIQTKSHQTPYWNWFLENKKREENYFRKKSYQAKALILLSDYI